MDNIAIMRKSSVDERQFGRKRVQLSVAPDAERVSLRAPAESVKAASKALGIALPLVPKTSSQSKYGTALWLGPDEWMILAEQGTPLMGWLGRVNPFHSAVDISHRNVGIFVEGEGAADVINAGCPQDLSLKAFPVGACSRTILGKSEIILLRTAENTFRVEVWRSFATYAFDFLEDAARLDFA